MPSDEQEKNYEFFLQQLPDLLSDPLKTGKYIIIYNMAIEGIFDTFEAAYRAACSKFNHNFIIQQIVDDKDVVEYLSTAVM